MKFIIFVRPILYILISYFTMFDGYSQISKPEDKPNFIIIFVDDMGYGDLGAFGHPTIKTPYLDQMAREGQKWTQFYVGASVCTPSRAALLTGRLPIRSGMCSDKSRVLFPNSLHGLPANEITLAEQLRKTGYATACIGKWHLGHHNQYLPTNNGFDSYFGIPYSNDMDRVGGGNYWEFADSIPYEYYNVPLLRDTTIVERPVDQHTLIRRYTQETIRKIRQHRNEKFFIYLAHNLPHIPLFVSDAFQGRSVRGLYGDVIEEIDYGVGEILATLQQEGLDQNTIVVFTSDNGPWLSYRTHGGSAGLLRAGKGMTWEGGMRVPAIFWGPGNISPGVVTELGTTMDLFATFSSMAGVELPDDRVMDGVDQSKVLYREEYGPRDHVFYYRGTRLYAVRLGAFKAHFVTEGAYGMFGKREEHDPPLLFNLNHDPSEQYNISEDHPDILEKIARLVQEHEAHLVRGEDQLADRAD